MGLSSMPFASPAKPSFLSSSSRSSHSRLTCRVSIACNSSRSRLLSLRSVRCDMAHSPIIDKRMTLPKFLESAHMENSVDRSVSGMKLFSGSANPSLSQEIASSLGLELGMINTKRFADGEIYLQLKESVRGCDVYLLQPTCPPANENLMELLIMIDACRRASAKTITAVIPYFGYARADRKTSCRESIAAKLVANLITEAGANRVLVCDIHSGQSLGYFDIPVDQAICEHVILEYITSKGIRSNELVVVSPDVGGVARARSFAKKLSDAPLAIVDKRRQEHNIAEVMNLIGDVKGKVAVMLDDMIDTAALLRLRGCQAADFKK
eukprot:XP_025014639.1 ribose-phosphate pyrophosphokinase 1, chloroplastic isoform X2 [Ricinus communis]